jgi:hypothetical protein
MRSISSLTPSTSIQNRASSMAPETVLEGTSLPQAIDSLIDTLCPHQYFFLFQKNLGVTNIQFAELLNLLRWVRPEAVGILESSEVNALQEGFRRDAVREDGRLDQRLLRKLEETLRGVFVVEPFYTCCVVYSPWELDLAKIVSKAGYMHSCGPLIYRNLLTDANRQGFIRRLRKYITDVREASGSDEPVLVQFYTHESYPQLDWKSGDEAEGLVDIKLDYAKSFFGWNTLAAEARQLEEDLGGLATLDTSYYRRVALAPDYRARDETVFVIRDYGFDWSEESARAYPREEEQYFLCYDSQYRKNNRVHVADEGKPYWAGSTTTPQRLTAAMINLVLPADGSLLCDPFAGTGTSILEAMKWPCRMAASDLFEPDLAVDNLEFFELSAAGLEGCYSRLVSLLEDTETTENIARALLSTLRELKDSPYLDISVGLSGAAKFQSDSTEISENTRTRDIVRRIPGLDFGDLSHRLGLYIVRKVLILWGSEIMSNLDTRLHELVHEELAVWADYVTEMRKVLLREQDATMAGRPWLEGHFARHVPFAKNSRFELVGDRIHACSATSLSYLEDGSVYAFVTDPPYGFNTSHNPEALLDLYLNLVHEMFRTLDPKGGHIVMCAVARTKTGKYSPTFCGRKFLTNIILREATEGGWTLQTSAGMWPKKFSGLPWYWRSKRGVDRYILHFQFRRGL